MAVRRSARIANNNAKAALPTTTSHANVTQSLQTSNGARKRKLQDDATDLPKSKRSRTSNIAQAVAKPRVQATSVTGAKRTATEKPSAKPRKAAAKFKISAAAKFSPETLNLPQLTSRYPKRQRQLGEQAGEQEPPAKRAKRTAQAVPTKRPKGTVKKPTGGARPVAQVQEPVAIEDLPATSGNRQHPAPDDASSTFAVAPEQQLIDALLTEVKAQHFMDALSVELNKLDSNIFACSSRNRRVAALEDRVDEMRRGGDINSAACTRVAKALQDLAAASKGYQARSTEIMVIIEALSESSKSFSSRQYLIIPVDQAHPQVALLCPEFWESYQTHKQLCDDVNAAQLHVAGISATIADQCEATSEKHHKTLAQGRLPVAAPVPGNAEDNSDAHTERPKEELNSILYLARQRKQAISEYDRTLEQQRAARVTMVQQAEKALVQADRLPPQRQPAHDADTEREGHVATNEDPFQQICGDLLAELDSTIATQNGTRASATQDAAKVVAKAFRKQLRAIECELANTHQVLDSLRTGRFAYCEDVAEENEDDVKQCTIMALDIEIRRLQAQRAAVVVQMEQAGVEDTPITRPYPEPEGIVEPDANSWTHEELKERFNDREPFRTGIHHWITSTNLAKHGVDDDLHKHWVTTQAHPAFKPIEQWPADLPPYKPGKFDELIPMQCGEDGTCIEEHEYKRGWLSSYAQGIQRGWEMSVVVDEAGNIIASHPHEEAWTAEEAAAKHQKARNVTHALLKELKNH
ncbi:hypothetical protein LTR95_000977 [Oleoguttula sp. CCFEE 5521]